MTQIIEAMRADIRGERKYQVRVLKNLLRVEQEKLFAEPGFSSLFDFVTRGLGLSEGCAARRIQVARKAAVFPQMLEALAENQVTLTTLSLLCPQLTDKNADELLSRAAGMSRLQGERLLVELAPKPEPKDSQRKLPGKKAIATTQPELTAAPPQPSRKPDRVEPITSERTSYRFTAGSEFDALYLEARALLSHQCPQGRMEEVLQEALKRLVASKTAKKGNWSA